VSPADAATLALGMLVQNPFAGTPSIIAINPRKRAVFSVTTGINSNRRPLPRPVPSDYSDSGH
jgi:hypothetical protein